MNILNAEQLDPQNPQPGVYRDVPAAVYFALPCVNKSTLDDLEEATPKHCKYRAENPDEETESLLIGHATHTLTLEGDEEYAARYVVSETCGTRKADKTPCSNPGKYLIGGEWFCGQHVKKNRHDSPLLAMVQKYTGDGFTLTNVSEHSSHYLQHADGRKVRVSNHPATPAVLRRLVAEGRTDVRVDLPPYGHDDPRPVLTPDQNDLVASIRNGVYEVEDCRMFIDSEGENELVLIWVDEMTGLTCKARLDMWRPPWESIGDLKTCESAGPAEWQFPKSIKTYRYHVQGAFYLDGANALGMAAKHFALFPVEKDPPHAAAAYKLAGEAIELGRSAYRRNLTKYAECVRTGNWPGYDAGFPLISVPNYEIRRELKLVGAA